MSDYKNKDYFDCSTDVDLDQCPVYQAWLTKCRQESIKQQIKEVIENEHLQEVEKHSV